MTIDTTAIAGPLHLTLTGQYAGTYLCGAYTVQLGHGSSGERSGRSAHYAYAPAALLERGNVTPDGYRTCDACLDALDAASD